MISCHQETQSPRDPSGSTSRVLHSSILGVQTMDPYFASVGSPSTRCPMPIGCIPIGGDSNYEQNPQAIYFQGQDNSQRDWETSFALVSTTRPTSIIGGSEQEMGQEVNPTSHSDGSIVRISDDQSVVDSLHFEIQQLQARIMSRLREPPTPGSIVQGSSQVSVFH